MLILFKVRTNDESDRAFKASVLTKCIPYLGSAALALAGSGSYAQDHGFSVRDSIEMTRFSDPSDFDTQAKAKFSPDGKHFLVITSRGLIESNQIESTLWAFSTDEVRSFLRASDSAPKPSPKALARLAAVPTVAASMIYSPIFSDLRWSPDSQAVYFLAQNSNGERQLYRVDINRSATRSLTNQGHDVGRFDIVDDTVVYTASPSTNDKAPDKQLSGHRINADGRAVTGVPIENILFPPLTQNVPRVRELWFIRDGEAAHQVVDARSGPPQPDVDHYLDVLSISPKGHFVIQLQPVRTVPSSWELYEPAPGFENRRIHRDDPRVTSPYNRERLRQYALVNLNSGKSTPLVDGPYGDALGYWDGREAVWSRDERRLLLTETFLPLNSADRVQRSKRIHPCAVAEVEISTSEVRCIIFTRDGSTKTTENYGSLRLENASFGLNDDDVLLEFRGYQRRGETERYRYVDGTWKLVETLAGDPVTGVASLHFSDSVLGGTETLSVAVKQSLNDPPILWATDNIAGRNKKLWDPNPRFPKMKFGEASVFHWNDRSGYEWTGGLVKPVDFIPGKRYPLIIQTHGFLNYAFMTDGFYPTAMAARPLASAGFAVLQTDYRRDHEMTAEESEDQDEGFGSAIQQLEVKGLIDPKLVGIIGFSRSSYHVESALIKDPKRFAAATIADGIDNSYMQYHLWGEGNPGLAGEFEKSNGGPPFGEEGLRKWIELAPGFHLNRVETPLRIEAIGGPLSILGEWEIYSSLRMQGRAVDLIYIPDGQHILQKPLDRMASQQGNVDWFRFWLQGYEDPDPSKKEQYERWRQLRKLQEGKRGHS
jgi:dipeptidyl aminopeptidase/acylaminoacyl peptidase